MNVNDFVTKLVQVETMPTKYKLGKFLNSYVGNYLQSDCSGLIKGILWGYPESGKYASNGVPDINADTMLSIPYCTKISTDFTNLPVGALVHMNGHIGVHVGNGVCIESSPKWEDGVQKTFINGSGFYNSGGLNTRTWKNWGLFKYIEYSTVTVDTTPTSRPAGKYHVEVETALVVREGPSTSYARVPKSELTADGKKHSNSNGGLLNNTNVTVYEWRGNWARIPSGWVCGSYLKEGWV